MMFPGGRAITSARGTVVKTCRRRLFGKQANVFPFCCGKCTVLALKRPKKGRGALTSHICYGDRDIRRQIVIVVDSDNDEYIPDYGQGSPRVHVQQLKSSKTRGIILAYMICQLPDHLHFKSAFPAVLKKTAEKLISLLKSDSGLTV